MNFTQIKIVLRFSLPLLVMALVTMQTNAQHRAVQLTPGATSFNGFGSVVSAAGDVNDDGFDDVIVTQPVGFDRGRVHVYYGTDSGKFTPQGGSVGVPDWQSAMIGGDFGSAIASGDFNCDNVDDVAIGAPNGGQLGEGLVYVYYGQATTGLSLTPDWIAESDAGGARFGWSVSNAGDVNNDGCDDLLIGTRSADTVTLVFGGDGTGGSAPLPDADSDGIAHPSDFSWQVTGTEGFGESVAGIGDVNDDGFDDILIGSRDGNIYIYYGVDADVPSTVASWKDSRVFSTFGRRVARGGDVNGDGVDDFIVGAPALTGGTVYLYYGVAGDDPITEWSDEVSSTFSHTTDTGFASTISAAGDLNGDGYDDIIVGWPSYVNNNGDRVGRVQIYHGSASGPAAEPDRILDGSEAFARFGTSVAIAGAVDGDTRDDFVISAPGVTIDLGGSGGDTNGTVFAYLSASVPHLTIDPPQSYTSFHVTSEDGATKTSSFSVVLDIAPAADVTIDVVSNNLAEGTVSPAVLTFTTGNWALPQTVNITGVDDVLEDGTVQYTLSFTVNSSAPDYNGLIVDDVTVRNEDDDVVAIIVDPVTELETTEDLGTATFSVVLDAQPTANVTIGLSSSNLLEGTVSPASLTFTPVDFRTLQFVTVTGVEDGGSIDGNVLYTIVTAAAVSADERYNNLNAADVSVINHDNDLQTGGTNIIEGDQVGSLFGRTVNPAGDINGDGFADFIVGAPKHDNGQINEGRVYVYFGAPTGFLATPWVAEFDQTNAEFGWSVAGAGDVNGDTFDDIIIGARKYDGGETDEGRVFVYYGSATGLPSTPDWMAEIDQASANFGAAVSSAGDVNGDGFDDILVGADNYYAADFSSSPFVKEGAVFLFYGSASGLPDTVPDGVARLSDGDVAWQGETGGAGSGTSVNYGRAVGSAGDVNCDGFADIIVGAPKYNLVSFFGLWGRVWVYHGGPDGLRDDGEADWTMLGPNGSTGFGSSVSGANNINGDTDGGYSCDDVIIGADGFESTFNTSNPAALTAENNEGRIYLYYGSPTGLTNTPSWTDENNQANSKLGIAAAAAGDLNNDGFADLIAGANRYDSGETDEGRVYIYFGSASGPGNPVTREIDQASALFGTAVAGTGDVDGDGTDDFVVGATLYDGDLFNEGAAILYLSDQATIKVYPDTGLVTTEAGGTASFSVVLTDVPDADVTIALSGDPTEGAFSDTSLVFTSSDWFTPQIVTITGIDDGSVDGDVPYTVIAAAVSADSRYSGMNADDVTVVNLDDEQPTVSVVASDSVASETDSNTGTFTVSRTGGTPSPLSLFYTLSGTAVNGVDYQSLTGSVTIAAGNSDAVITLTPLLDGLIEASETVMLTLSIAANYTVGAPANASVTLSDGTASGITISPTSGLVTTEQGGNDTFSVVLNSRPTEDVTIHFASDTLGEGNTLVSSVIFTETDWDSPQIVTVVGQDDTIVDTDQDYIILTSVTSDDNNYAGLNPVDVAVTNRDDDALSVVAIRSMSGNVREKAVGSTFGDEKIIFRVSRIGSTASNLTVNYSVSGGTATSGIDYITPSGTVTILGGQSHRDIFISTVADPDPEGHETITLSLSDDATYIVGSPRADTATIRDSGIQVPVSFGPDQIVAEGATISVPVVKRDAGGGTVSMTYTVAGSAMNPADHDAANGSIGIGSLSTTNTITFSTFDDGLPEGDETVIFTLESISGAGVFGNKITHTVTITDANLPPATTLTAVQGGRQTRLVIADPSSGNVTLTASVVDANPGDNHSYNWSLTNNSLVDDNLDGDPATFVFDPSGLMAGFYKVRVTVSDNGSPMLAVSNKLLLEVVTTAPELGGFFTDTDGDSINDSTEFYDDSDNDGIPDYLDPNNINGILPDRNLPPNALQQVPVQYSSYVMWTDPGLSLRLGDIAFAAGSDSAQVSVADIANFGDGEGGAGANAQDIFPNSGGYFDFEIVNLPIAGSSARVVIPQFEPIPSGAQYRKYHPINGWNDFFEDDNNMLSSAPGMPGLCPMPRDVAYTPGLTVGDFCVQLIIQDGGPNDTDGLVNHAIEDPGQIGIADEPSPAIVGVVDEPQAVIVAVADEPQAANNQSGGGGIINLTVILSLFLFIWVSLRTRCKSARVRTRARERVLSGKQGRGID